jgi:hypothetical protein
VLPDYLEGAVDLHVHSAPDVVERRYDDIDLAREAARAGMGAILLKSHQSSTVERAYLVQKVVPEIAVHGGLVLNDTVGGFNPAAVRLALELGASQIWMPTKSALQHRKAHGQEGGLTVFGPHRELKPEVDEILRMMAQAGCILGSGHLAPDEVFAIAARARQLGVATFMITHPEWTVTPYSIADQQELAAYGNVMFERCFVSTTHLCGFTPMSVIERAISEIGVQTTVIATDLGQPDTPPPVEGLRSYAEALRSAGFSLDDLRRMMRDNPMSLLDGASTAVRAAQESARPSGICATDVPDA